MTKTGSIPATQKQKDKLINRKVPNHLSWRKQDMWKGASINADFFLNNKGNLHKEFIPPSQTVNSSFYVEVLRWQWENVWKKWPDKWWDKIWLLNQNNAPANASLQTLRYLDSNNASLLPHLPYSLYLASYNFFFLPKLKMKLKGRKFQLIREHPSKSQVVLNMMGENDFQECDSTTWSFSRLRSGEAGDGELLRRWWWLLTSKVRLI